MQWQEPLERLGVLALGIVFTCLLLWTLAANRAPYARLLERVDACEHPEPFTHVIHAIRVEEDEIASDVKLWYLAAVTVWLYLGLGGYRTVHLPVGARLPPRKWT